MRLLPLQVEVLASAKDVEEAASHVIKSTEPVSVTVGIAAAEGVKCERCWNYSPSVAQNTEGKYPAVCR